MANKIAYIIELQNRFSAQAKAVAKSMKHIQNTAIGVRADLKKMDSAAASTFKNMERNAERAGRAMDKLRGKYKGLPTGGSRSGGGDMMTQARGLRNYGVGGVMSMVPGLAFIRQSVLDSGDVTEQLQQYRHIFGTKLDILPEVEAYLEELSTHLKTSKHIMRRQLTKFAYAAEGHNIPEKDIWAYVKEQLPRTYDITAMRDQPSVDSTGQKMVRGFMGELDSLKEITVFLSQEDPDFQRALKALMKHKNISHASARYMLMHKGIMLQSNVTLGAWIREMEGLNANIRRASETTYDARVAIGSAAEKDAISSLSMWSNLMVWVEELPPWILRMGVIVKMVVTAFFVLAAIAGAFGMAALALSSAVGSIVAAVVFVGSTLLGAAVWLANMAQKLGTGIRWVFEKLGLAAPADYDGEKWVPRENTYASSAPEYSGKGGGSDQQGGIKGTIQVSASPGTRVDAVDIFHLNNRGHNMATAN